MTPRKKISRPPIADLNALQAASETAELRRIIHQYDILYHQQDAPAVSDAEYDALRRRLEDIEAAFPQLKSEDSPTQKVGAAPAREFSKVRHALPMLSLANAFSEED